ncbi:MAG: hypothetical protein IPN29_15875 [Saprospiraceae bacterium]|nr:hypothetical protein [Saprospiraceae bacterium]
MKNKYTMRILFLLMAICGQIYASQTYSTGVSGAWDIGQKRNLNHPSSAGTSPLTDHLAADKLTIPVRKFDCMGAETCADVTEELRPTTGGGFTCVSSCNTSNVSEGGDCEVNGASVWFKVKWTVWLLL